jgi:hypothetical protein
VLSGQLHAPAALPPGKDPQYPLDRSCVGPTVGLDDVEKRKFLTLEGLEFYPSVFQLVASRYTEYASPATRIKRL